MSNTTIQVGVDNKTLGTIEATPDGLKMHGDIEALNTLIGGLRRLRFYGDMSDEELVQEMGRSMRGRTWAQVVSPESEPANT